VLALHGLRTVRDRMPDAGSCGRPAVPVHPACRVVPRTRIGLPFRTDPMAADGIVRRAVPRSRFIPGFPPAGRFAQPAVSARSR